MSVESGHTRHSEHTIRGRGLTVSQSPDGFAIVFSQSIGRTESRRSTNHIDPERFARLKRVDRRIKWAKRKRASREKLENLREEKRTVRKKTGTNTLHLQAAVQENMRARGVEEVRYARAAWKDSLWNGAPIGDQMELRREFFRRRRSYLQEGKTLGLRDVAIKGNEVTANAKRVTLTDINPNNTREFIDLVAGTGIIALIRTADGKFVIQHRAAEEQPLHDEKRYGYTVFSDSPGASIDVALNASMETGSRTTGTPDPIDTDTLKADVTRITGEKLGLSEGAVSDVRIVGLAQDDNSQDELLMLVDTSLTSDVILERPRSKPVKRSGRIDIIEKFVAIDATAEDIETLLTKVKVPLPPTHVSAFIAAGYSIKLQNEGREAANEWKMRVEEGVEQNYREIDEKVRRFYEMYPEVTYPEAFLNHVPERFWNGRAPLRNPDGYSEWYRGPEQGLKGIEDAMVEAGFPETRRTVDTAYIFDLDGVIFDPVTKRIENPEILDEIANKLKRNEPVCLNTGRPLDRVQELIDALLERFADDKTSLLNLAVIAEFGGAWATFDANGTMHEDVIDSITVPPELEKQVKQLIDNRFSTSISYKGGKSTMLTVSKNADIDMDTFIAVRKELKSILDDMLIKARLDSTYHVLPDRSAVNIMSPYVGKDLGVIRFLQFLQDRRIKPKKFKAFGDSLSDLEMLYELRRRGKEVEYYHLGPVADILNAIREGKIRDVSGISSVGRGPVGTLETLKEEEPGSVLRTIFE